METLYTRRSKRFCSHRIALGDYLCLREFHVHVDVIGRIPTQIRAVRGKLLREGEKEFETILNPSDEVKGDIAESEGLSKVQLGERAVNAEEQAPAAENGALSDIGAEFDCSPERQYSMAGAV